MSHALRIIGGIVAGIALAAAAQAAEKEQRVKKSDLPAAVQAAAERESTGATVRGYSKVVEKGQVLYEMDLTVDGHAKAILIGADGNVAEVEEEVPWERLPPEVQAGLKQRAGKRKIGKVTAISKNTTVTGYEADVVAKGKRSEIEVGPDGKPPAPPVKTTAIP